ncbi:precorrin-8X methylmutase [Streptomyces clavifer]|nr:precorrin-8X methylmutase [Streptomyces clavifer]
MCGGTGPPRRRPSGTTRPRSPPPWRRHATPVPPDHPVPEAPLKKESDSTVHQYEKDGPAIYRQSFATIRAEADLAGLPADVSQVAVRMIHACGMVDLVRDLAFSPNAVADARAALRSGAPILCDVAMVASGVTRKRLPADNDVICTLSDPAVPGLAAKLGTTRSAAALELWRDRMEGAVVAVGNAPTALFRLLEMIEDGAPRPAAVIGVPVGFIGAAESKEALAVHTSGLEHLIVRGRRGGSALAAAALNAIASEEE